MVNGFFCVVKENRFWAADPSILTYIPSSELAQAAQRQDQAAGSMDGWTDRQTDGWTTDGWTTDGWTVFPPCVLPDIVRYWVHCSAYF